MYLEQNLKGLCTKFGVDFQALLADFNVDSPYELALVDLETITEEYEIDLQTLIFSPIYENQFLKESLEKIKLLILDVDGVMTDGGMYYTENGDQIKKFNAKDGMAVLNLTTKNFPVGIISSGFYGETIRKRAEILRIDRCYVGREPKLQILQKWCVELGVELSEVAIIGDDINDLEVMKLVGFSACPSDAVQEVKKQVNLILTKKGGEGVVREFIDNYFNFITLQV